MLRTLSNAGCGAFEYFDSKTKSKWNGKVKEQLQRARQPGLTSVAVHWETHGDEREIVQAPSVISAIFSGSRQVIYGFVNNCTLVAFEFLSTI
jgi:poly [ADP-ribose] polymerase